MTIKFYFFLKTGCLTWLLWLSMFFSQAQAQVYANSQTNGISGLCLLCTVTNPQYAVDSNLNNYTSLNIDAGLLGTAVYQTLIFPAVSSSGCDSLIIRIASGNIALSINLFAGITVQTFNGATANNDLHVVDSSNLRLILNNTRGEIILKPTATFDRVKVTLNSSLLGLLNSLNVYYAYAKPAIPMPIAPDSTAICAGSSTTLSATGVSGATFNWYTASTGGTLLTTGSSIVVSPGSTTTYYVAATVNGCTSLRKAVKVIVNARPANPAYAVPQGISCGNTSLTITNYQPGINYQVGVKYSGININGDTSLFVTNSNTITIPDRNYYFNCNVAVYIQAVNALTGCKSDSVSRAFVYGGHADSTDVTADSVVICKGDSVKIHANLHNDTVSIVLIRWYNAPTGGTLLSTGPNFTVRPAVTTTYYATAAFQCEYPVRTPVKVIVQKLPNPDIIVPEGISCGRQFLPALNYQPGYNYQVHAVYSSFTRVLLDTAYVVHHSGTIAAPAFLSVGPSLVDMYIQAIDTVSGCRSDTVHVAYNLGGSSAMPVADTDSVSICAGDSATLHAYVPIYNSSIIRWYDVPTGGQPLFTGYYFRVSPATDKTYYAASSLECEFPKRVAVKVTVGDCLGKHQMKSATGPANRALKVFPNPTAGRVGLSADRDLTGYQLIVYDSYNREVMRQVMTTNSFVLPSYLTNGIYIIKVINKVHGIVYTEKIVFQYNGR